MYQINISKQNGEFDVYSCNDYNNAIAFAKTELQSGKTYAEIVRASDNCLCWTSDDSPYLQQYLEYDNEKWINLEQINHTSSDKPSVYFDIDGTLGFWYQDTKGFVYPDEVLDPKFHYFRNIEPHPFMITLAKELSEKGYDVCVISSADKNTIRDKWSWLQENCSFIKEENLFFCPLGADKTQFVKGNAEKSILIDDYKVNLEKWVGIPAKAVNSINSASKDMISIDGNLAEKDPLKWDGIMNKAINDISHALLTAEKGIVQNKRQYIKE